MKLIAYIFCFILQWSLVYGQNKCDYNWQLGSESEAPEHPDPLSLEISFLNGSASVDVFYRPVNMGYFNASLSDSAGHLLLYSNGCKIFDRQHRIIEGSENLSPGNIDLEWCVQNESGYPLFEGGLLLPFNNDSLILLLHQSLAVEGPPLTVYVDALYYTSLLRNENSYTIDEKTVSLLRDSLTGGRLEAIQRHDGNGWWVIQAKRSSNEYFTISLVAGEVDTIYKQIIGDSTSRKGEGAAQSAFSPNGKLYASYSPADGIYLFDFNRVTGILSNYRKLQVAEIPSIGGMAFSSNSQYLYACTNVDLFQFDILSNDIQKSKLHIAHYDGHLSPFPTTFFQLQLAPDCKIYGIPQNGSNTMHIINNPNRRGIECEFQQHSLELPTYNTITLPNFPVCRIDPYLDCDSTTTKVIGLENNSNVFPLIYPNPTANYVTIALGRDWALENELIIEVYNMTGSRIYNTKVRPMGNEEININMMNYIPGLYLIKLQSKHKTSLNHILIIEKN